jgi:hypothetical protein
MPFSHTAVDWPRELNHILSEVQVTPVQDGKPYCRIDLDVDAETLLLLNEFEARARHRQVRLRPAGREACVVGEMNTLVGLGSAADPSRHVGRVRLSFHDLEGDDCVDPAIAARHAR